MTPANFDYLNPVALLPHKAPMLLVDRVVYTDFQQRITVETAITKDSPFIKGHFPGYPLLPGVIIIEMMFQACGILNRLSKDGAAATEGKTRLGRAVKIRSAVFMKEVLPDSLLTVTAEKIQDIFGFSEYEAIAAVAGQDVCKAALTLSI